MNPSTTPEELDEVLPQTQCGLCGYKGCMPYAEAMVYEKAAINLCTPGGVDTLLVLGTLTQIDATPYVAEMRQKAKPKTIVNIREAECIGCTKCIQVCPVDAILGAAKQMHTVISDECTGCDLCIPACPVDCIDILSTTNSVEPTHARMRFNAREKRLKIEKMNKQKESSTDKRKQYIEEALTRVQFKKLSLRNE